MDADIHGPVKSMQERVQTRNALAEACSYLEHLGLIAPDIDQSTDNFLVTRRGHEVARSADACSQAERRAHFPLTIFRRELRGAPYDAFVRGNLQQAISDAFRVVEVRERDESGLSEATGCRNAEAFDEDRGPLNSNFTDKAERQALAHLFAGSFGWVRNPASHRDVPVDDVFQAIEQLKIRMTPEARIPVEGAMTKFGAGPHPCVECY